VDEPVESHALAGARSGRGDIVRGMEALADVPPYFIVVAVISFLLVVAGMTVYTRVMNQMEEESDAPPPAPGAANFGVPPPEPLHGWVVMCAAFMDNGASWLAMPVESARAMLANGWGVDSQATLEPVLMSLAQAEPTAWNGVRLFRVALAGVRCGYIPSAQAFVGIHPVAQRLRATFPGFDAVWNDYLGHLRAWKGLPTDGTGDDAEIAGYVRKAAEIRQAGYGGVNYGAI
jgi:hypothetical protein